jgi:hypothetical protein
MSDELRIELLREALQTVLDEEMPDEKSVQEFGGYHLGPIRKMIEHVLAGTDQN